MPARELQEQAARVWAWTSRACAQDAIRAIDALLRQLAKYRDLPPAADRVRVIASSLETARFALLLADDAVELITAAVLAGE